MRPITNEDIKILGRLVNISTEGVVADASQVYDSTQHKNQEVINSEMKNKTKNATTTTYGIVRLASGKNDADNTDVPTIKILRDAIQDAIDGILEDPNHTLQDQLNSIRELANAINNDASFYTTIQNWLAQKADKSAFDTLKGRVDDLAERVAYLEECCEQVHQYMDEFSITWSGAGSSHVRISPAVLRAGTNTAVCTIDNGWHCSTPLTRSNVLGDYDTITQTGTDTNIQLVFTGVRSNIVINAPITKTFFNITKHVIGTDSTDTYPFEVVYSGTHANAQTIAAGTALNLTVTGKTDRDVFNDGAPVSITIGDQAYGYSWLDHSYTTIDWLNGEPHSITIQIPASDINGDIELFFNGWHESSARLFVQISPNPNVSGTPGWQTGRPQYYYGSGSNPGYTDVYDGYSESVKGYFVNYITNDSTHPDQWPISATSALQTKLNNNDPSVYRLKSSTGYEGRAGSGVFTVSDGPNKNAIKDELFVWFTTGGTYSGYVGMTNQNEINDDTDYTITIETETIPLYTISYVGMTGRFHTTNTATSVAENASFSTDFIREAGVMPGASMTATNVTMGGVDITTQATAGSHDVDIDHVTGNVVITVQESEPFMFDGEITIDVPNGSASPDTLWADGTSQTSTITPNNGYTLTGARALSDNNEVTASINGSTLTVSGQSYNNTTITVTLPAEGSTPSGNTAVITVNPSYACDGVNESITIGQPWSHTFVLPEYYDDSSYPVTSGSGHTRTDAMRSAYTYVSDTITMAGGGTITRNGNTFSTQNVTGNITGEIVFALDQDVIYGHFTHGTIGGYEEHVSESDPTLYENTRLTGKVGDKLRVTHIDSGYTLTGSTIRASRNPHFENGVWTSGASQIDTDAVANNLSWDATTGEVTVVKPFFYTLEDGYFQIVLKIDTANPPASIEGYMQFLSGSTQEDNAGISGSLQGVAYGQTYTSPTNKIKPLNGWILDTTKGTNGISVINKITYQPMLFTVGAPGSGQEYTITVPNVVAPYYVGIHVKQGS